MKSVILALIYAAVTESAIYRFASNEYLGSIETILMVAAIAGAVGLGIVATRPLRAFCGATALAAPAISYSMVGYGLLEMGGVLHAFAVGMIGAVACKLWDEFGPVSPTKKQADDTSNGKQPTPRKS